ncbi:MAG: DUF2062 domain-containing protein [Sideroxydans sp.]
MRKFFKDRLPNRDSIARNRWLKPYAHWLTHPNLWHLNRRSAAGGVALGMICGLVPGPLQMLSAALLAVWLRVNLPLALLATLYTNPFTIVPLYLLAYRLGSLLTGAAGSVPTLPPFPEMHGQEWFYEVWEWLLVLGQPLLLGLPALALTLAVIAYIVVRLGWRCAVVVKWRRRAQTRSAQDHAE